MPTGSLGYVKYGYETAFGGGTPSPLRAFGYGQKLSASEKKNNLKTIYGLGSQDAGATVEGIYEGRLSVDFEVSNMWYLMAALGMAAGVPTGSGPYVWTPGFASALPSMVIENGLEMGATDFVQTFKGVVAEQLTLSGEVGNNPIHAKLDCLYQTETAASSGSTYATPATDTQNNVFNFAQSKLEVPTGTVIGNTDRFSLTIKRNPKMIYGLGSRLANTHVEGIREYEIEFSALVADTSLLALFFGGTGQTSPQSTVSDIASVLIGISNDGFGAAVASSRRCLLTLNNCKVDSYSPPMEVENAVMQALTLKARTMSFSLVNNEATKPTDVTA